MKIHQKLLDSQPSYFVGQRTEYKIIVGRIAGNFSDDEELFIDGKPKGIKLEP